MRSFYIVSDVLNIDKYLPEIPIKNTLVVHIDIWDVVTKYRSVKWSVFKNSFIDFEENNIVIVGMNRIRTDASRYDMVYSHIYKLKKFKTKIIIDEHPFSGEPWRLWYVYGFLFHTWIMGENSMPLQGQWSRWFEREIEDCAISPENIHAHISNTYSDKELLTTKFELIQPDLFQSEKYNEVKRLAFEKYDTPRQIISYMLKGLDLNISYESYLSNETLTLPDFGISRFMVEENLRRMEIYNKIIDYGRKNFKR